MHVTSVVGPAAFNQTARMQACIRLSFDSRRGKSGGTTAVPFLVVTIITDGGMGG
jgi:hypothetical protein